MNDLLSNSKKVRAKLRGRAILRAMHFIQENEKVVLRFLHLEIMILVSI